MDFHRGYSSSIGSMTPNDSFHKDDMSPKRCFF